MELAKCKMCGERHRVTEFGCPKDAPKKSRGGVEGHAGKGGKHPVRSPLPVTTGNSRGEIAGVKSGPRAFRRPLAKDAHKTIEAKKPWDKEGVSRRTWYRNRPKVTND